MITMRSDVKALLIWTALIVAGLTTVAIGAALADAHPVLGGALVVVGIVAAGNAGPHWRRARAEVHARHHRDGGS
jgi:hypothetical protein